MTEAAGPSRALSPLQLSGRFAGAAVSAVAFGLVVSVITALVALALTDDAPAATDSDGLDELVGAVQAGLLVGVISALVVFVAVAALLTRDRNAA